MRVLTATAALLGLLFAVVKVAERQFDQAMIMLLLAAIMRVENLAEQVLENRMRADALCKKRVES